MALTAQSVQVLKLADVWKSYDGADALKGVTFEAQAGEIHALLGAPYAGAFSLTSNATVKRSPSLNGTVPCHIHDGKSTNRPALGSISRTAGASN